LRDSVYFKALGLKDNCEVLNISKYKYADMVALQKNGIRQDVKMLSLQQRFANKYGAEYNMVCAKLFQTRSYNQQYSNALGCKF